MELSALAIVLLYVLWRMVVDPERSWRREFILLATAALVSEHSCIQWYGFYTYDDDWLLKIGHMPVTVALIWPVVILSAMEVARSNPWASSSQLRTASVVALVVLADASLIEPIAVRAGLWRWTVPGFFGVPIIGVLGWAWFTWLWTATEAIPLLPRILGVFAGLHGGLLAAWWGGLRLLSGPIDPKLCLQFAQVLSVVVTLLVLVRRPALDRSKALMRAPGALYFAGVLVLLVRNAYLAIWAAAIALPWLVALARAPTRSVGSR